MYGRVKERIKKNSLFLLCGLVAAFFEVLGVLLCGMEGEGKAYVFQFSHILMLVFTGCIAFGAAVAALYAMLHGGRRFVSGHAERSRLLSSPGFYYIALLVGWLPCYLAYFPAIYSYDGEPQLIQYTEHAFNNHHPIAHTLILGGCYDLGRFLQRLNCPLDGMAIYAFLQMLLLAGAFTCGFAFLIRRGAPRRMLIATLLWCAFFPVHPLMAVSTTKDTFFTAFFLMVFFALVRVMEKGERSGRAEMISLCLGNLGMMLFRKNGLYIQMIMLLIFTAAALRWLLPYMKTRRKTDGSVGEPRIRIWFELAAVTLLSICLFCGAEAALVRAVDAEPGESAEALNIPLQQLARAYKSGGETMSEEDLELLYAYLPPEGLANYRPYITDGVKMYFNNDLYKKDPAGFWRIYLRLFRKYPGSYLIAPAYLTMGDWFLTDTSHTSVYKDWWRDRMGYLITDATPVFAERFVKKENLLPAVRNIYEALVTDCVYQRFLPAQILFAPALYCFLTLFAGIAFVRQRRCGQLVPWAVAAIYFLTAAAGPCVLVRYVYPFMALMPFLAFQVLREATCFSEPGGKSRERGALQTAGSICGENRSIYLENRGIPSCTGPENCV